MNENDVKDVKKLILAISNNLATKNSKENLLGFAYQYKLNKLLNKEESEKLIKNIKDLKKIE